MENTMGMRIKQLRLQAHMTQEELGKVIGVNKAAIQKYESGQTMNMKRSKIAALSKFFKVSPTWLMGFEDSDFDDQYNADGKLSKELQVMDTVADTFGESTRDFLFLLNRLDDVDKARIMERMQTMLEDAKYQKEELQAN